MIRSKPPTLLEWTLFGLGLDPDAKWLLEMYYRNLRVPPNAPPPNKSGTPVSIYLPRISMYFPYNQAYLLWFEYCLALPGISLSFLMTEESLRWKNSKLLAPLCLSGTGVFVNCHIKSIEEPDCLKGSLNSTHFGGMQQCIRWFWGCPAPYSWIVNLVIF